MEIHHQSFPLPSCTQKMRGPPYCIMDGYAWGAGRFLANFVSETFKIHITASQQLSWELRKECLEFLQESKPGSVFF